MLALLANTAFEKYAHICITGNGVDDIDAEYERAVVFHDPADLVNDNADVSYMSMTEFGGMRISNSLYYVDSIFADHVDELVVMARNHVELMVTRYYYYAHDVNQVRRFVSFYPDLDLVPIIFEQTYDEYARTDKMDDVLVEYYWFDMERFVRFTCTCLALYSMEVEDSYDGDKYHYTNYKGYHVYGLLNRRHVNESTFTQYPYFSVWNAACIEVIDDKLERRVPAKRPVY